VLQETWLAAAGELVKRAETEREIVEAVLALDEPYRRTVLLRYYEGVSCADLACEQGIPAATVRSRMHRGLERMRARLDDRYGRRDVWCAVLVPIVGHDVGVALGTLLTSISRGVAVTTPWWLSRRDAPGE